MGWSSLVLAQGRFLADLDRALDLSVPAAPLDQTPLADLQRMLLGPP